MPIVEELKIKGIDVSYKKCLVNGKQISHVIANGKECDYPDYFLGFSDGQVTGRGDSVRTDITIPHKVFLNGSITSITGAKYDAFYECDNLQRLVLSSGITYIGEYAFAECYGLKSVVVPKSVSNFGEGAFAGCRNLENIYFDGTKAEWNSILKGEWWNDVTGNYTVHCTDGDIAKG